MSTFRTRIISGLLGVCVLGLVGGVAQAGEVHPAGTGRANLSGASFGPRALTTSPVVARPDASKMTSVGQGPRSLSVTGGRGRG